MVIEAVHIAKKSRFKTTMFNASLCDSSDAYILVEARITVFIEGANGAVF